METFWDDLCSAIMLRKDISSILGSWSAWISPGNIMPTLLSSEGQKGKARDVHLEDATMISQEDLEEAFHKKTKKELINYLKNELNITADERAAKDNLMAQIIDRLYYSDAFKKKLASYSGMSGGFLTFTCTHGVVYAVKA